ncbi:MAG: DUF3179 domain-containing protein [Chloroflexi bacterium]|nr:MAG: DUF3179 domain-containing protein [Chloroflexota bacterium]
MKKHLHWPFLLIMLLAACSPGGTAVSNPNTSSTNGSGDGRYDEYEIITLLPRDGIPAIDNPQFVSATQANDAYDPDELIIGVEFNSDARAYSVPLLSSHEIVNDTVGGEKIAVTW